MSVELKISENKNTENEQVSLVLPARKIISFDDETFKSISKLEKVLRRIKKRMSNDKFMAKNDIISNT